MGLGGVVDAGSGARSGTVNVNVEPSPSSDSTPIAATVALDHVPGDGQAEARAAATHAGAVGLVEPLEDAGPVGLRDPDPVVAHGDGDDVALLPDADHDLAALGAELHGVVDEVDEHLAEAVLVAADERDARRDLDGDRDALALREQPQPLRRGLRETAEVDVLVHAQLRAALDPGEVEQLVDHLDEMARLHLHLRDPLLHPLRDVGALGVACEGLGEQAHRRERRPQLVAQVVDELRPDLLQPAELGDVLEDDVDRAAGVAPRPHEDRPRLAVAGADLGRGGAAVGETGEHPLHARVEERLHDRAPDEPAGRDLEEGRGTGVRRDDLARRVEPEHAHREQVVGLIAGQGCLAACALIGRGAQPLAQQLDLLGAATQHEQGGDEGPDEPGEPDHEHRVHAPEDRTPA